MALGVDGAFYGTTIFGGTNNQGTGFRVTTNGALSTLLSFNGTNGSMPYAGLVLGGDGACYGTTVKGGSGGGGSIFRLWAWN